MSVYLPDINATIHMKAIDPIARTFVETYRNGKQMAYQRSIEIKVSVNTETLTETVYRKINKIRILRYYILAICTSVAMCVCVFVRAKGT